MAKEIIFDSGTFLSPIGIKGQVIQASNDSAWNLKGGMYYLSNSITDKPVSGYAIVFERVDGAKGILLFSYSNPSVLYVGTKTVGDSGVWKYVSLATAV